VAVVNETFARRYVGSTNPIGATVRTVAEPRFPSTAYEVIGVVSDTKYSALREPIPPITFVPIAQHPSPRPWPGIVPPILGPAVDGHGGRETSGRRISSEYDDGLYRIRHAGSRWPRS